GRRAHREIESTERGVELCERAAGESRVRDVERCRLARDAFGKRNETWPIGRLDHGERVALGCAERDRNAERQVLLGEAHEEVVFVAHARWVRGVAVDARDELTLAR